MNRTAKKKGKTVSYLLSSSMLAASMLLGQTGEPAKVVPAPSVVQQQQQPAQRPILGWFQRDDRPVMSRIQSWWKRDQPESQPTPSSKIVPPRNGTRETEAPPLLTPPAPPADFPRKLPNPSSQAPLQVEPVVKAVPQEVQQVSAQQTAVPAKAKSPVLPHLANKIGRDEKFDWITGQIELENGNYVMYYATAETVDKYNGRIVLAPQQTDMSQFKHGDLVSIRGQLAQRPTAQGVMPIYRITHASLIERAK